MKNAEDSSSYNLLVVKENTHPQGIRELDLVGCVLNNNHEAKCVLRNHSELFIKSTDCSIITEKNVKVEKRENAYLVHSVKNEFTKEATYTDPPEPISNTSYGYLNLEEAKIEKFMCIEYMMLTNLPYHCRFDDEINSELQTIAMFGLVQYSKYIKSKQCTQKYDKSIDFVKAINAKQFTALSDEHPGLMVLSKHLHLPISEYENMLIERTHSTNYLILDYRVQSDLFEFKLRYCLSDTMPRHSYMQNETSYTLFNDDRLEVKSYARSQGFGYIIFYGCVKGQTTFARDLKLDIRLPLRRIQSKQGKLLNSFSIDDLIIKELRIMLPDLRHHDIRSWVHLSSDACSQDKLHYHVSMINATYHHIQNHHAEILPNARFNIAGSALAASFLLRSSNILKRIVKVEELLKKLLSPMLDNEKLFLTTFLNDKRHIWVEKISPLTMSNRFVLKNFLYVMFAMRDVSRYFESKSAIKNDNALLGFGDLFGNASSTILYALRFFDSGEKTFLDLQHLASPEIWKPNLSSYDLHLHILDVLFCLKHIVKPEEAVIIEKFRVQWKSYIGNYVQ